MEWIYYSPPAILLRQGYREDSKVKTRTLANLSKLPPEALAVLRQVLKGEKLVKAGDAFEALASSQTGKVQAVLGAMQRLGFAKLIAARPSLVARTPGRKDLGPWAARPGMVTIKVASPDVGNP